MLSLTGCHIINADEPSITAIFKRNTLKLLYLTLCRLGPEAVVNLFSTLIDNTSLETVDLLCSNYLDEGDIRVLPGMIDTGLSKNNTLKVLRT